MRDLTAIKGFLTPVMTKDLPNGRKLNAFDDIEIIRLIKAGYACGECAITFTTFRTDCPLCGLPTDLAGQYEITPEDWQQYVNQRNADVQTLGPGRREVELPPGFDRARGTEHFLHDLHRDRDVDQVPLSKLKPSKHGRGG